MLTLYRELCMSQNNKCVTYRYVDGSGVEHATVDVAENMFYSVVCEVGYHAGIPQVLLYAVCDEESPLYRAERFISWSLNATIYAE